jgi:hypothetical protein
MDVMVVVVMVVVVTVMVIASTGVKASWGRRRGRSEPG